MTTYSCTVIYGWYEGDLHVWDEIPVEVTADLSLDDKSIKAKAVEVFHDTVGKSMGGYAFAFVDTIEISDDEDAEDKSEEKEQE